MARAKPSASALVIELFGRQQNFDEKTWRLHNSTPAAHPRQRHDDSLATGQQLRRGIQPLQAHAH